MKSMNLKRIASTVLAGALTLSMAVPALAAEKNTTNINGTYTPINLAVTVPSTGKAVINPYGLPYTLDENNSISGQQITTGAPLTVQNRSSVALSVSAKITGEVPTGSGFTFATAAPADTVTDKEGYVLFQMFPATALTEANLEDASVLIGGFAKLDDADALPATPAVVATTAKDVADIITLREGKDGELQKGGAAYFRLSGNVAKKAEWTTADTFSVKVAFTFEPAEFAKNAGTLAAINSGDVSQIGNVATTIKLTPDKDLPADFAFTTANTKWELVGERAAGFTLEAGTNPNEAKVKVPATGSPAQSGEKVTLKVTVTDADGIPYVAEIECTAA